MGHSVHNRRIQIGSILLAFTLLVASSGCSGQQKAVETAAPVDAGILVETSAPQIGDLETTTEFIATIEPDEVVSVYPKVAGTVSVIHAQVGDQVKKGDLLFEIDPTDIQLQVNVAKSALNSAQASVLSAQASVDQQLGSGYDLKLAQLESQVKSAQTAYSNARQSLRDYNDKSDNGIDEIEDQLSKVNASRIQTQQALDAVQQELRECVANGGTGSDEWAELNRKFSNLNSTLTKLEETQSMLQANYNELDDGDSSAHTQLRTAVKNAQLAYDSATTIYELTNDSAYKDALKVANATLGQATAGYEQAAASFEQVSRQLVYTKVYSPIDGIIEAKNISEQSPVSQSMATYTVSNKDIVTAVFYVPSEAAQVIMPGDTVTVENGARTATGTVTEVGSMTDASNGLFKMKASVDNTVGLMTGLSVKVIAKTAHTSGSLLIPIKSVYYDNGQAYVYAAKNGQAVKTPIQTGISDDDLIEVLTGITAETQVITSWNNNLRDGVKLSSDVAASTETPVQGLTSSETNSSEAENTESSNHVSSEALPPSSLSEPASQPGDSDSAASSAAQEG